MVQGSVSPVYVLLLLVSVRGQEPPVGENNDTIPINPTQAPPANEDLTPKSPWPDENGNGPPLHYSKEEFLTEWLLADVEDDVHSEYEGYDGWYNNPTHPELGAVDSQLVRLLPPAYQDGVYQPSGQDRPNPIELSEALLSGKNGMMSNTGKTAFLVFFGQQVVEEVLDAQRPGCPPEYFNVPIPKGHNYSEHHSFMPVLRSRYNMGTGQSPNNPRQQINEITPWLDGGLTYGTAKGWSDVLRSFRGGELANASEGDLSDFPAFNQPRLPMANPPPPRDHLLKPVSRFFRLGNPRGNENPFLLTMGVMWFRWHNRLAKALQKKFPSWSDEKVYNEARKWVIATHQHIVVDEWLPEWLGESLDEYRGYDGSIDPGIAHEFQSAAMRFGHTLVTSGGYRRSGRSADKGCRVFNTTVKTMFKGHRAVRTCNSFWNPQEAVQEHDIDGLILGLSSQPCEREDNIIVEDLRGRVFGPLEFSRRDLMAINIQRGRDHGLPDYKTARRLLKLDASFTTFQEMAKLCSNVNQLNSSIFSKVFPDLYKNYTNPTDFIDIWVGGILETEAHRPGLLFRTIIKDQFRRIRDGDRFWFENRDNGHFTETQVEKIKKLNIYSIIWSTTKINHGDLQGNPFRLPSDRNRGLTQDCRVNLTMESYTCTNPRAGVDETCFYLPPLRNGDQSIRECTRLKTFDYFDGHHRASGSRISYTLTYLGTGVFTLGCIGLLFFLARRRLRKEAELRKKQTGNNPKAMDQNSIAAREWLGPKDLPRHVVVQFNPSRVIGVQQQNGRLLRSMDLRHVETLEMRVSTTGNHLLVRVAKDYDLVLQFDGSEERDNFISRLEGYLGEIGVGRQRREVHLQRMLKEAITREDRQKQLEMFFRVVFAQAFDITHDRSEVLQLDASQAREIIATEITIFEFADSLSLRPDALFVQQMFALVDKDNNGYISFREFLDMIIIFAQGSPESKMKLMFDMYDFDHSGKLSLPQFTDMIKSMLELANHSLSPEDLNILVNSMFNSAGLSTKQDLLFADFTKLMGNYKNELGYAELCFDVAGFQAKVQPKQSEPKNRAAFRAKDTVVRAYSYFEGAPPAHPPAGPTLSTGSHLRVETTGETEDSTLLAPSAISSTTTQITGFLENYRLHVFWQVLYGLCIIGIFIERVYYYSVEREHGGLRRVLGHGVSVTRGAASSMMFAYSTLLLTTCQNTITFLRDTFMHSYVPFDAAHSFHKVVAYWGMFFTVIHVIGHAFNFYQVATQTADDLACLFRDYYHATDELPKFHYWAFGTITGLTGILVTLLMIVMYVFATGFSRRHVFGAFWKTHNMYPVFYILTILHGAGQLVQRPFFYYFLLGPLCLFVIDKLISISRKKVEISVVRATIHPSDVIQVEMKPHPDFSYKSGQWVRIATPVLNGSEYHPFTLSSAPHEEHISLHIRAVGPWTRNFKKMFDPEVIKGHAYPKVYLDGPFGEGHQDWFKFEVAVLVGGGIGVTPFASILKDVANKSSSGLKIPCKRLYFLWVTRTQKHFEWMTDIIRDVEEKDKGQLVQVNIFITQFYQKFDLRTTMLYICERHFQRVSNRSLFSGLRCKTHFGRPNIRVFLNSLRNEHPSATKVGVFSCGPPPMTREVQDAADQLNKKDGAVFVHHYMNF